MTKSQLLPMAITGIVAWLLVSAARHYGRGMSLVLVLVLAVPYWLGPVLIWLTNRSRVPRWNVPTALGLESLPTSIRPFFDATDRALVDLGFSLVSVLQQRDLAPGFSSWVALYVDRAAKVRAVAHAHMPVKPQVAVAPKPALYFVTKWADGRLIETANSSHVSPFPRVPGNESRQFPEVVDPKMLYRIHQLRSAALGSAPRDFPAVGAEVACLTKAMADFYQTHVGTGYLRAVEPGQLFRPTVKGATLMTWRLLPPMTWLARWRRRQRNRAFLSEHHLQVW
jgi:hypothetical protein